MAAFPLLVAGLYFFSPALGGTLDAEEYFSDQKLFDLNNPFDSNTVVWPGDPLFRQDEQTISSPHEEDLTTEDFGTHLDTAYRFNSNGRKVGDITLRRGGNRDPKKYFSGKKLIDLSYPFDANTVVWPGGQAFRFTRQDARFETSPYEYWYAANDFKTAEHCGTHLDAPYHFNKKGWKVGDIPLERLVTVAAFVNASRETNGNRDYKLPVSKLIQWEKKHGRFPKNSVILVSFGWAQRYGDKEAYLGPNGTLAFPGLSKEAAQWIVKSKRVVGVGVDTASVDQGENVDVHVTQLGGSLFHLENVAIRQPLPPLFNVVVMPMKLANGTGAPCRILALV